MKDTKVPSTTLPIEKLHVNLETAAVIEEMYKKELISMVGVKVETKEVKLEEAIGYSTTPDKKPEYNDDVFITIGGYFKVKEGLYKTLHRNVESKVNTLLLGPTGVGKTELVSNIAKMLNLPITIFDMGTMTDPIMSLVGTHIIKMKDGVTTSEFSKSRFSQAIQQPGIILLDELSRANAMANNLLFPCLDFRRELPMEYCFDDTSSIKVHPDCVFFATANLGSQYTGTHKLDRALTDRFMPIEIDALNSVQLKEAIKLHCFSLTQNEIETIVSVYTKINDMHDNFTISFNLSIRHLKMIADLVRDGFTIYDSFYIICKGIGGKEANESFLKPLFGN